MLWLLAAPAMAQRGPYTVNTTADSNDGTEACGNGISTCSLRDAITLAMAPGPGAGATINFSVTGTITLQSALPDMQNIVIQGPGASQLTVSGNNAYQVFSSSYGGSVSGLTIANGFVTCNTSSCFIWGGGILTGGGTFTVTDVNFVNNAATCNASGCLVFGGAIMNEAGTLQVTNSTFSGNSASCTGSSCEAFGGAIVSQESSTLTVSGSTFSGNSAEYGGAVSNGNNCSTPATATFTNSTFSDNSAFVGGGLLTYGSLTVNDSTISGNSANYGTTGGHYGGGIYNDCSATPVILANSIVSGNVTRVAGGKGIGTPDDFSHNSYTDNGGNIIGYANGAAVNTAAVNLLALGSYGGPTQTMLPQPGSPAICLGKSANVPSGVTTDQRGWPLASNCPSGYVDSGAVQTNYSLVNTLADTTNHTDSTSCTDGTESSTNTCSLRDLLLQTQTSASTMTDAAFAPSLFVSGNPPVATPGTITLGSGLYAIDGTLNLAGPGVNLLTVSGNSGSTFDVNAGATFSLYGLSSTHGYSTISNYGTATVADCAISAATESGIFNGDGATLTVNNCTFSANYAPAGGGAGIFNFINGSVAVSNSTFSGNNANGAYGGGIYSNGSVTVTNSTFSGNTASYGGAIHNGGTMTLTNSTVAGNTAFSVGGIEGYGTVTLSNSIVAGNSPTDLSISGTLNDSASNQIGFPGGVNNVSQMLGSLASSPAAATVQTMMPVPGATSLLCAGSAALLPSGVTTDERGFPMDPNCTSGAVDLGAAQTNYTGYVTTGYNGAVNLTISPSPTAEVLETNALTGAQDSVGGIPVTLTLVGNGTLSGTATQTTAPTTVNNATSNLAVYGGLSINAVGTGDSFTPSIGAYTPTANVSAGTFNISAPTVTQLVFTTPPATPLQEGNAESVVVSEETAGGATVTTASDTITLTVLNSSSNVVYTTSQAASSGVASFSVPASTLPVTGTYTFTASVTGNSSITPASQQVAFTSLTLPSATLAGGTLAASYSAAINAATNGAGTVTYALASGSQLPAGLSLTAATGAITGTPAAGGSFNFSIQATDSLHYTATQSYSITIGAATPTVTLTSNLNPAFASNGVIFTATVGLGSGAPTGMPAPNGTVTFYANGTAVCTAVSVASGSAACTASFTAAGTDQMTAAFTSSDANYTGATTASALSETVATISLNLQNSSISVAPGGSNTFNITIAPSGVASFPQAVQLSASGLPSGVTASFSPSSTIAAGSGSTTITVTIQASQSALLNQNPAGGMRPMETWSLALLLLPFAGRLRRASHKLRGGLMLLVLAVAGLAGAIAFIGCGSGGGGSGSNSGPTNSTYNVTITATSGSLTSSSVVTLTVN